MTMTMAMTTVMTDDDDDEDNVYSDVDHGDADADGDQRPTQRQRVAGAPTISPELERYDYLRELTCSKWVEPKVDGLPVFLPWPISAGGYFKTSDGAGDCELLPEPVGETEWYIPHGKLGDQ